MVQIYYILLFHLKAGILFCNNRLLGKNFSDTAMAWGSDPSVSSIDQHAAQTIPVAKSLFYWDIFEKGNVCKFWVDSLSNLHFISHWTGSRSYPLCIMWKRSLRKSWSDYLGIMCNEDLKQWVLYFWVS